MSGRDGWRQALVPPLTGLLLVVLFLMLGFWQLDRAEEKRRIRESFEAQGHYATFVPGAAYAPYQRLRVSGRYLNDRQFLIENIVENGRLGYYVVTPLEIAAGEPLLLVNRGWVGKDPAGGEPPAIAIDDSARTVRGRIGHLPRVGFRPGPAFAGPPAWPRHGVWPESEDIAAALGRKVLPFVLLEDPNPASPLERHWQPQGIGPMRHIGYAVQWFALAVAVVVIGVYLYRRRRSAK